MGSVRRYLGVVLLAVVVGALALLAQVVDLPDGAELRTWVDATGTLAPAVFVAVCAVGTSAFFPKPVLATAAGLLFGVAMGTALAVVGFAIGALIAFSAGRRLGRSTVAPWLGERLRVLETVFARRGVEATLVLRLLPVLPFTLANYGAGVTAVRWQSFGLGTAIGLVPSTVLAALLGDALSDLGSTRSLVAIGVWSVLSAVGLWWGRRLVVQARENDSKVLATT
ncbi:VTT domain-containing protein [Lentzea sp. NPDC005914]|uniref:TVP38/TMEM64 family protein n=1 Tax=Lentzea sp. NPDC005914 TaxID=3154572 RepID=UPI0033F3B9D2